MSKHVTKHPQFDKQPLDITNVSKNYVTKNPTGCHKAFGRGWTSCHM
jgi:hypothetical protein